MSTRVRGSPFIPPRFYTAEHIGDSNRNFLLVLFRNPDPLRDHNRNFSYQFLENRYLLRAIREVALCLKPIHPHTVMENVPFFYPPRLPGKYPKPLKLVTGKKPPAEEEEPEEPETATAAPSAPPPKSCPMWAVRTHSSPRPRPTFHRIRTTPGSDRGLRCRTGLPLAVLRKGRADACSRRSAAARPTVTRLRAFFHRSSRLL